MSDVGMPLCYVCKHFNSATNMPTCTAYPKGIPYRFTFDGEADHIKAFAGDNGIQFELDPNAAEEDVEMFQDAGRI